MSKQFEVSEKQEGARSWLSRRLLVLVALLTASALVFSACGGDGDDSSSSSGGDDTTASTSGGEVPEWCGDEKITLGIQDGGGLNAWSKESLAQVRLEAAKCPNIEDEIVVNAGFDPQKATSGIQSMVAQGANAIVINPSSDFAITASWEELTIAASATARLSAPAAGVSAPRMS